MKKRLEAELISIAHRVLKLKNKSDVDILLFETRKIYEALSVLKFYNNNFEQLKDSISITELNSKLDASFDSTIEKEEIIPIIEEETVEEVIVAPEPEPIFVEEVKNKEIPVSKNKKETLDFEPLFETIAAEPAADDAVFIEKEEPKDAKQIVFEDFIGESYTELDFVKPTENQIKPEIKEEIIQVKPEKTAKSSAGIVIGLNDRVGFEVHLFNGLSDDYNRVLSQLNTFDSFKEAQDFIENMVKPDYNNWEGQEYYSIRFMEIIENKFS